MSWHVGLITVGHGRLSADDLAALLHDAGVRQIVDVRRYPGSRAHPHLSRDRLADWLPAAGIGYRWEQRWGGRRRVADPARDTWWQVASFQAYAQHMRTPDFLEAAAEVRGGLAERTAVMCSEAVWWRCHRRLIADFAELVWQVAVRHLGHDGRLWRHRPATGAAVEPGGMVAYGPAG